MTAGSLALLGSFANFTAYNNYSFFQVEVAYIAVFLTSLSCIVGFLYYGQREWGKIVLEIVLLVLIADLNTDGIAIPVAAGAVGLVTLLVFHKSVMPFIAITGGIVLATSLLGLSAKRDWISVRHGPTEKAGTNAPAIIHLILDEHIGIEGIPHDYAGAPDISSHLKKVYVSGGFRLFGRAHSKHLETVNSIPHIFNYDAKPSGQSSLHGGSVGKNKYFEELAKDGYQLHIFQSEWIDFCSENSFRLCKTYWSPSLRTVPYLGLNERDQINITLLKFLELSDLLVALSKRYDGLVWILRRDGIILPEVMPTRLGRTSTVTALLAFNDLIEYLEKAEPGDAYVAHLLIPHFPYSVNADCEIAAWPWENIGSRSAPTVTQKAYFEQVKCVTKKVGEAVNSVTRSPAGGNFVFLVHGDHGSRLPRIKPSYENIGNYGDAEEIAGFSTLFAAKIPGVKPGYQEHPATVGSLLRWAMRSRRVGRALSPPVSDGVVILSDEKWRLRARDTLPRQWLNGGRGDPKRDKPD